MSCFNSIEIEDCFVKNVAVFLQAQFCDSFREKGRSRNVSFSEMIFENFKDNTISIYLNPWSRASNLPLYIKDIIMQQ